MEQSYIFGPGTGKTYADIVRMRDIAEQFGQSASGVPQTGMEGIHAIADALISRKNMRKADKLQDGLVAQLGPTNPLVLALMGIPQSAVPQYKYGTDFHPGGPAIVGEDGPELLMLPRGAKVKPNPMTLAWDQQEAPPVTGPGAMEEEMKNLSPEERARVLQRIQQGLPPVEAITPDWYDPIGEMGSLDPSKMVRTAEAKGETATDGMPKLDLNVTESQRTGQALRLLQAEATLRELEASQGTRGGQRVLEWLPDFIENYAVDEDYGRYQIARDAFVEAAMRADTGATINVEEWPRILKTLTVQPGDGPERIAERRAMRETIIKSLMAASGEGRSIMPQIGERATPIQDMSDDDLLRALQGGN